MSSNSDSAVGLPAGNAEQRIARAEQLLSRITPGQWQLGTAGNANVVSYDGDDIRPIATVGGLGGNRRFIAEAPQIVRDLLAALRSVSPGGATELDGAELIATITYNRESEQIEYHKVGEAAAPEPLSALPQWQPIETAPDATYVLVWLQNYGVNVAIQTKHPTGDHWWMRDHHEYCYPTHWMPLPAPPSEVAAALAAPRPPQETEDQERQTDTRVDSQ